MATVEIREKDRVLSDVPGINQLPSELLAKIFVLVEKTYRHARLTSDAYVGFQDTATAQLYLARSGTRLLHVDLVIHPPDIEGLESLAEGNQVIQMLEMMVDAPGVEIFQLGFEISQQTIIGDAPANGAPTNEILQSFFQSLLQIGGPAPHTTGAFFPQSGKAALARFISSGRLNGALQKTSATGQPGAGPLFPSLCTLALPDLSSDDAIYADLLGAYAGVTKVTLSTSGVKFLSHEDRFLPRLTHLRCLNDEDPASMAVIKEAVEKRKDWGMGLSLLELVSTDSEPEGRKPMEETEKDFGNALDGLVVRKIMDWRFGWLGVYDIEDCIPT
ncbi:hypothetical protein FRC10_008433 [Ceratobasidium sp. 414]|nr:hypothetical protein FRC10_008433 [Ceratobasidium sp. 414]